MIITGRHKSVPKFIAVFDCAWRRHEGTHRVGCKNWVCILTGEFLGMSAMTRVLVRVSNKIPGIVRSLPVYTYLIKAERFRTS